MLISDTQRNGSVTSHTNLVDGGAGPGTLEFRTGAAWDADTGTLLCTITYQDPSYAAPTGGSANAAGLPLSNTAAAAGTPGHYREKDSNGVVITQGSVTLTGSGGDFEFDNLTWQIGATVNINTLSYAQPAGSN